MGLVVSTQMNFVSGPPSLLTSTTSVSTSVVVADGVNDATIGIVARDAYNNVVALADVVLSATNAQALSGDLVGITDATGVFQTRLRSTLLGVQSITVRVGGVTLGVVPLNFIAGPASIFSSSLSLSSTTQTAGDANGIVATLVLQDSVGHVLPQVPVSFASTGSNITFSVPLSTDALGLASATLSSSQAQSANVVVSAGGLTFTAPLNFLAGPPDQTTSSFALSPASVLADGATGVGVSVTGRDVNGNATPGVSVALAGSGGNNVFASIQGTTTSSGVFITTLTSTQVQSETLSAVLANRITLTAPVTFTAGPPQASSSSLAVVPAVQTADGNAVMTARLLVRDAYGHPLPGLLPTFSASGSSMSVSAAVATDAQGQSLVALKTTLAQNQNVTASVGPLSWTANAPFVAGPMSASYSALAVSPNTAVANGNTAMVVTAHLADRYNNAIVGQNVALSMTGGGGTFTSTVAVTNGQGLATAGLGSWFSGPKRVFAEAQSQVLNANVKFTARPVALCIANPNYGLAMTTTAAFGAMLMVDTNNDGISDMVVANGNLVTVYAGNGQGLAASGTSFDTGGAIGVMATADLNGDGWQDLIVSSAGGGLRVVLNSGSSFVVSPARYPTAADATVIVTDDFDGDGRQDVALALGGGTSAVAVMLNAGGGLLAPATPYAVPGPSYGLTTVDLNRDGTRDLVATSFSSNTLSPMLGVGDGTFAVQTALATGAGPKELRSADFNVDGSDDVVVLNATANSAGIYLNGGTGTLQAPATSSLGTAPSSLVLDDLNGDSIADIVTLSVTDKTYSVLLGFGNGSFTFRLTYPAGTSPTGLVVGDFNRDGYRDVLVASGASSKASLYLYNSCLNALGVVLSTLLGG